jgi:hypothetical protein
MQFPSKENDVVVLATEIATGLAANPELFPAPPMTDAAIETLVEELTNAQQLADAAKAAAEDATAAKLAALEALVAAAKKDIRYAENLYPGQDTKLKLLGWGAKKEPTPMPPPGTATDLVATVQNETSVSFSWKKPADGGSVSTYVIERRVRPEGPWSVVATSLTTETTLDNQQRQIEWEFRVKAVNKNGEGMESNTVMVVL